MHMYCKYIYVIYYIFHRLIKTLTAKTGQIDGKDAEDMPINGAMAFFSWGCVSIDADDIFTIPLFRANEWRVFSSHGLLAFSFAFVIIKIKNIKQCKIVGSKPFFVVGCLQFCLKFCWP